MNDDVFLDMITPDERGDLVAQVIHEFIQVPGEGVWTALAWLGSRDLTLGIRPIDAIREGGRRADVIDAAQRFLMS